MTAWSAKCPLSPRVSLVENEGQERPADAIEAIWRMHRKVVVGVTIGFELPHRAHRRLPGGWLCIGIAGKVSSACDGGEQSFPSIIQ